MIPYRDENPLERTPVVTLTLIGANLLVFTYSISSGHFEDLVRHWGHTPASGGVLTLFTSMFLHGGLGHLLGNMLYLWLFGDNVEDKFGRAPYLSFYLGAGVLAGVIHSLVVSGGGRELPTVGASGAISGVLGAYLVMFPWANVNCLFIFFFYPVVLKIPALFLLGLWIVGQLFVGFLTREVEVGGVAYFAHIGGFFAGIAAGLVYRMSGKLEAKQDLILDRKPHLVPRVNTIHQERVRRAGARTLHALHQQRPSEVVESYARFERTNPARPLPEAEQWAAAEALRREGHSALALEAYRKYVKHYPMGPRLRAALLAVGELFQAQHNFPAALQAYEALVRQFPESDEGQRASQAMLEIRAELERTGLEAAPADADRTYILIRQTGGRFDVGRAGKTIARACGLPVLEGRMLVARTGGVLAVGLSYEQARAAATELQAGGVPVLAVPQDEAVYYPDPVDVREIDLDEGGADLRDRDSHRVRWENLWLVCLGLVAVERIEEEAVTPSLEDAGVGLMRPFPRPVPLRSVRRVPQAQQLAFLDLFFREPMLHFRLRRDRLRMDAEISAEAGLSRAAAFTHLAKRIVERAPQAHVGEGIDRLFSEESLRSVTFRSMEQYENYLFWQVQLHAHSFAANRERA